MGEYRNNPAIFDRLNYTKSLDKANGAASLQHIVAGNGNQMTAKQLYSFKNELRLRKIAKLITFFSLPALVFYYKRNFALGAAAFVASSFLADRVYASCVFNFNDSFTKEYIKKSKMNYLTRIAAANEMVPATPETAKGARIQNYSRKEFRELFKYR
jgi:hypothetical protein